MMNSLKFYLAVAASTIGWLLLGFVISRQIDYPQIETITLECIDRTSGERVSAVSIQLWNRKQMSPVYFEATANNKIYAIDIEDSKFYQIDQQGRSIAKQHSWNSQSAIDALLPALSSSDARPITPIEMTYLYDSIKLAIRRGTDGVAILHKNPSSNTLLFQPTSDQIVKQNQLRFPYQWTVIGTFGLVGFMSTWIVGKRISAHCDAQTRGSASGRES